MWFLTIGIAKVKTIKAIRWKMFLMHLSRSAPLVTAGLSLLTTWGDRMGARQFCIWQWPLWLATNSEAMALDVQHIIWAHLDSQKACNPSQITSVQLQESVSFPQQCHGLAKWSSLLVLFSSCLSLVDHCISVQHHSQSPCEDCQSDHRGLEDTDAILLRAAPMLLSFVCLCFFFLLAAVWNFLFSAQGLYHYPPNHSHFTGFQKSYCFSAYMATKPIFLDSFTAVLISTPCSVCCWAMQRGRWAALICAEAQRGCAYALAYMSCVWSFCSLSTEVLPELQPLVQQH